MFRDRDIFYTSAEFRREKSINYLLQPLAQRLQNRLNPGLVIKVGEYARNCLLNEPNKPQQSIKNPVIDKRRYPLVFIDGYKGGIIVKLKQDIIPGVDDTTGLGFNYEEASNRLYLRSTIINTGFESLDQKFRYSQPVHNRQTKIVIDRVGAITDTRYFQGRFQDNEQDVWMGIEQEDSERKGRSLEKRVWKKDRLSSYCSLWRMGDNFYEVVTSNYTSLSEFPIKGDGIYNRGNQVIVNLHGLGYVSEKERQRRAKLTLKRAGINADDISSIQKFEQAALSKLSEFFGPIETASKETQALRENLSRIRI